MKLTKIQYSLLTGTVLAIMPFLLFAIPGYFGIASGEEIGTTVPLYSYLSSFSDITQPVTLFALGGAMVLCGIIRLFSLLDKKIEHRDKYSFWTYIAYIFLAVAYGICCYYFQSTISFLCSLIPSAVPLILLFVEAHFYSAEL